MNQAAQYKVPVDVEVLTANAHAARLSAEKAWYELFYALPVGAERTHASEVYERIRRAAVPS
jgi:hypothetical protein